MPISCMREVYFTQIVIIIHALLVNVTICVLLNTTIKYTTVHSVKSKLELVNALSPM